MKVLAQALQEVGRDVSQKPGARDEKGEDGFLIIDGEQAVVQVVSILTDPAVWKELAIRDASFRDGDQRDAIELLRSALEHKKGKATGSLLAIDATHLGAVVGPRLVQEYLSEYGNPSDEFSLKAVWIVGPTARSTFCLE